MRSRLRSSGTFLLPVPAPTALPMFTPEGEREWVPGWDPHWPGGRPDHEPGSVWTTATTESSTVWVVERVDTEACTARYARVTPGTHAGTVQVRCREAEGGCEVQVDYDLTALPGAPADVLAPYEEEAFDAMLDQWRRAVLRAIGQRQ